MRHTLYIIVFLLFCCIRGEAQQSVPYTLSDFDSWHITNSSEFNSVWKNGHIPSATPYSNMPTTGTYFYINDHDVNYNGLVSSHGGRLYSISETFDFSTVAMPVISFELYYYFDESLATTDPPILSITYGSESYTKRTLKSWINNLSDDWEYVSICDKSIAFKNNVQLNIEVESFSGAGYYIAIRNFTINGFKINDIEQHPVSCFGYTDGSIDVSVEGAGPDYAFSKTGRGDGAEWETAPTNTNSYTFTNLTNTGYSIAVKDVKSGCVVESTNPVEVLSSHDIIGFNASPHDVTCYNDDNGSITVFPLGNTNVNDFVYSKDNGVSFQSSNIFSDLSSGGYDVLIKTNDAAGCKSQANHIDIGNDAMLEIKNVVPTHIETCFGEEIGEIKITAEAKRKPIKYYVILDGGPSYPVNNLGESYNLPAGKYHISVNDDAGCNVDYPNLVEIKQPTKLEYKGATTVDVLTCFGEQTGAIEFNTPVGGTPGYMYSIDGVNYEPTPLFTDLVGNYPYRLSVKDSKNCKTAIQEVVLSQPTKVVISDVKFKNVASCYGATDGTIDIVASGGTGDLKYSIEANPNPYLTNSHFNVGEGIYYPKVVDTKGCTAEWQQISISQPTPVEINYITAPDNTIKCNGQPTGKILLRANGGVEPYSILVDNNQVAVNVAASALQTINNRYAGTYSVQIEDNNGCKSQVSSVTITQPSPVAISVKSQSDATCKNAQNASVVLEGSGGIEPYTYAYKRNSVGGFSTSPNATLNLFAGTYDLKIRDANQCESLVEQVTLGEPDQLEVFDTPYDVVSCFNDRDGKIEVTVTGGTAPYKFALGSGDYIVGNSNTYTFTNLGKGHYDIRVDDSNGCGGDYIRSIYVGGPNQLTIEDFQYESVKGCNGEAKGQIKFAAQGGFGNLYFSKDGVNFVYASTGSIVFNNLPAGHYTPMVKDSRQCTQPAPEVDITEPDKLIIEDIQVTDAICYNDYNGIAKVTAKGGQPVQHDFPYFFYLDDLSVINNYNGEFKDLHAGDYTFYIKDDYGCTVNGSFTIKQPDQVEVTKLEVFDITTCHGDFTGSATIAVKGGTGQYTYKAEGYNYASENTTGVFANMPASGYEFLVTDSHKCFVDTVTEITQPTKIRYAAKKTQDINCHGDNDAAFQITASGGTAPYWYTLDNGNSYPYTDGSIITFNNVDPGIYTVKAKDSKGCTDTYVYKIEIIDPPQLTADYEKYDVICNTGNTGKILSSAAGGTKPYKFSLDGNVWKPNAGVFSNLTDSVYSVIVKDAHDCQVKLEGITLTRPPNIAGFTLDKYDGCSPLQVTMTQDNDGGLTTYVISNGTKLYDCTGPTKYTFTNTSGHNETYTIKASMMQAGGVGCTDTASVQLTVFSEPNSDVRFDYTSTEYPQTTAQFVNMSQNITSATWDFGDGKTSNVINETSHTYDYCGNYNIILIQSNGQCYDTVTTPFVIEGRPVHALMKANITQGCQPITVRFTNESSNSDSCVWDFGDGTTSKAPKPTHKFEGAGDYLVSLTAYGDCGAASTATKTIHVCPKPTAGFEQNADTLYEGQYLVVSSLSSAEDYYLWDFGDGQKSEDRSPIHQYAFGGTFPISLIVTTSNSCSDTAVVKNAVTVIENPIVVFPNAFTPNNDGINDIFKPVHGDIASYKIVILNRQGQIMYNSTDIDEGWDGTRNGRPCPTGVYVYKANYVLRDHSFHELKGYIVLLKLPVKK